MFKKVILFLFLFCLLPEAPVQGSPLSGSVPEMFITIDPIRRRSTEFVKRVRNYVRGRYTRVRDWWQHNKRSTGSRRVRRKMKDTQQSKLGPPIKRKIEKKKKVKQKVLSVLTSFPLNGDNKIVSRKMLDGIGSYLRGYKHFLHSDKKFVIKHEKNNNYDSLQGVDAIRAMIKDNKLFIGFVGTELFMSLEQELKRGDITLLFPIDGLPELRAKRYKNVVYFRPPLNKELEALAAYAIKKRHKTDVAILYEASRWGESALKACKEVLKKYDVEIVSLASYPQGTVEIEKALNKITESSPNAVFCLAKPRPAYTFIRYAMDKRLHGLFLGISDLNSVQKILKTALGIDLIVTSVVPNVKQEQDLPIVREYQKIMKNFLTYRADSPFYFEAFVTMALLEWCMQNIENDITPRALVEKLESQRDVNFKGLPISFNGKDRSLSSAVWVNPGVDRRWMLYKDGAFHDKSLKNFV